MKRLLTCALLVPALALLTGVAGCGKEEKKKFTPGPSVSGDGGGASGDSEAPKKKIGPGTATLVGKVTYDGDPPAGDPSFGDALRKHADSKCCAAADAKPWELNEQTWMVGPDKGVRNVVVWLSPPAGSEFEVKPASGDAVLDQPHCVYIPHVLAITPGQKLVVKNSATVQHNTKLAVNERVNKRFGETIGPGASKTHELKPQKTPVTATCDFHGWMRAYIWVLPHQYVAVTDEKGNFQIDNVPEGEFAVVAWHEDAPSGGFFHGGEAGTRLAFKAGEKKQLDLKVKAK